MKFKLLSILALTALTACNTAPPPGWSLELRAGTTNVDASFFQSTKPETTRSSVDETHFAQLREAIIKKVPNLNLGSTLASGFAVNTKASNTNTRETKGLFLSLFMAVSKDGAVPTQDLSFTYSGPTGGNNKPLTYPAGNAWIASPFVSPKGNGQYNFSSTLQDGTLAGNVNINFEDQTQWLPLPLAANPNGFGTSMVQSANVFIAHWQAIPEAQSYLGFIYDKTDEKTVASFLTKDVQISTQKFASVQGHVYSLDLIATNIDLTKDSTKSYGNLPDNMKSSIASFDLKYEAPQLSITQTRLDLLVKPSQSSEVILPVKNTGYGPLSLNVTVSGEGLQIVPGNNEVLFNNDSRDIHITGTCTNADVRGAITITSNDPINKTRTVPVLLECDTPLSATLELQKLTHRNPILAMQYSPNGTKIATTDGSEVIIWDAKTSSVLQRFGVSVNDILKGTVYSLAWNPDNNLLLVGSGNNVVVLNTSTGLITLSLNPSGLVLSLDWNFDGSQFVIGIPYTAIIYSNINGSLIRQIDMPEKNNFTIRPLLVSWSKSSHYLATSFHNNVYIWDSVTGTQISHYIGAVEFDTFSNSLVQISWNPTGDKLAMYDNNGGTNRISIWKIDSQILEKSIIVDNSNFPDAKNILYDIQWSPSGSDIAIISRKYIDGTNWDFSVEIWDSSTGLLTKKFPMKTLLYQQTSALIWNPNGSSILTRADQLAFSQNVSNGDQSLQLGFIPAKISALKMNPDANKMVIASSPDYGYGIGNLSLMNIPSGSILPSITTSQTIVALDWKQNTEEILGVLNIPNVDMVNHFNSISGNLIDSYEGNIASVFSPNGQKIATVVNKSDLRLLDSATKTVLRTIHLPECAGCNIFAKYAIAWSSDGTKVAVRDGFGNLMVFDVSSGTQAWLKTLSSTGYQSPLLWSPNNKFISSGYDFYDATDGTSVIVFEHGFFAFPLPLAWSPDSRYLLTQMGNLIELRNSTSGRKIISIRNIPSINLETVKVDWNIQTNRFAFSDAKSSVYIYKFSQP